MVAAVTPEQLNFWHAAPIGSAAFKVEPEDFIVKELFQPPITGTGEHLYLQVEKRNQNSLWVAAQLAQAAGIEVGSVGFCGLKDRRAVTQQWYSLHLPGRELNIDALAHDDYRILQSGRGSAKLRRGDHSGNHFVITLRDIDCSPAEVEARIETLCQNGFANYFGLQRFGRNGNNLAEVERLVQAGKLVGDRGRQRAQARRQSRGGARKKVANHNGLLLSAARSWLFNQVLHARLNNSEQPLQIDDDGPLWGRGRALAEPLLAEFEATCLAPWKHWCEALEHSGLQQQRRPLIGVAQSFEHNWLDETTLRLSFELGAGEYATSLLRELLVLHQLDPASRADRECCAIVANSKNSSQCGDLV